MPRKLKKPGKKQPSSPTEPTTKLAIAEPVKVTPVGVRKLAMIDFITDPKSRSIEWHYSRPDREFSQLVSIKTFQQWASEDNWQNQRSSYFDEIARRIIKARGEEDLHYKREQIESADQIQQTLQEWVTPLLDEYGDLQRYPEYDAEGNPHPWAGKPKMPLPFKNQEGAIKAFSEMLKLNLLLRGEATSRTEQTVESFDGHKPGSVIDPKKVTNQVSAEDIRAMANALVRQRQPDLEEQDPIDLDDHISKPPELDDDDELL